MTEEGFLTDDFVRQLINVGEVDILVGLPTYNNAKTIGSGRSPQFRAASCNGFRGIERRSLMPTQDRGMVLRNWLSSASIDDVRQRDFNRVALRTLHSISTQYGSSVARGTALRTILAAGELLRAEATAIDFTRFDEYQIRLACVFF